MELFIYYSLSRPKPWISNDSAKVVKINKLLNKFCKGAK